MDSKYYNEVCEELKKLFAQDLAKIIINNKEDKRAQKVKELKEKYYSIVQDLKSSHSLLAEQ